MDYQKMIILFARVQGVPTQVSKYIVIFETIAFTEKFEGGTLHYPLHPQRYLKYVVQFSNGSLFPKWRPTYNFL